MIRNSIVVRAGCSCCGDFFDVDLMAIRTARGPDYSLIDQPLTCRRTVCRGRAYFVAAIDISAEIRTLVSSIDDPLQLKGLTAADLEPPPMPPAGPGPRSKPSSLAGFVHQIARSLEAT